MSFSCCFLLRKIIQARKIEVWLVVIWKLGSPHPRQDSFVSGSHDSPPPSFSSWSPGMRGGGQWRPPLPWWGGEGGTVHQSACHSLVSREMKWWESQHDEVMENRQPWKSELPFSSPLHRGNLTFPWKNPPTALVKKWSSPGFLLT